MALVAAAVLVGAVVALIFVVNRDDAGSSPPPPSEAATGVEVSDQLIPTVVVASSELGDDFAAHHLIDGDPTTFWNDASLHGLDAELAFQFSGPVTLERLLVTQPTDVAQFRRNHRIRAYELVTDAGAITGELSDQPGGQEIVLAAAETTTVVLRVTSVYEPEVVDGLEPFEQLAVQEVEFYGLVPSP